MKVYLKSPPSVMNNVNFFLKTWKKQEQVEYVHLQ